MCGFVIDRGRDVEEINFISGSRTGGGRMVREACLWQCCVFSASEVSQVSGCGRLMKVFDCILARVNMELALSLAWFIFWIIGWHGVEKSGINGYGV